MALGKLRMQRFQQVMRFPRLQNRRRLFLARDLPKFAAGIFRRNRFLQLALHGQLEPFRRARLHLEFHARRIAQRAQQAHRLIGEAVNRKRANLAALEIGEAIGRIEQQARANSAFREIAMALMEKSRRLRSSMIVEKRISGFAPGRA